MLCESYDEHKGILNGTETCKLDNDFCAVLWREVTNEQNEPSLVAVFKGCFAIISLMSKPNYCEDDCIQRNDDIYNVKKGYGFCCCKLDMCNKNFTSTVNYTRYESTVASSTITTAGRST